MTICVKWSLLEWRQMRAVPHLKGKEIISQGERILGISQNRTVGQTRTTHSKPILKLSVD